MKSVSIPLVLLAMASAALGNTAPTVVIQSATMRPGTTLMDVVYRVNDPDDATVKTRALAFVDGVRSFAKVLKPVTFVEGTAAKLGDAIPANVNHTLTWDVAVDWDVDLGQVKFEVLAMDGRGMLPIDWITIPAAGGNPALTISKDTPSDASILDALLWQYADGDAGLYLANGVLQGSSTNGIFAGIDLADGSSVTSYGPPFIFKRMDLDPVDPSETNYAVGTARAGLLNTASWHAANRPYGGVSLVLGWGNNYYGQATISAGLSKVIAIAAGGFHSLALTSDGTVVGYGSNEEGQASIPAGLSGVTAIAAGESHSLAVKSDGTVVGWGWNEDGQATPPDLWGVIAIAAGERHSVALKSDGTTVCWGDNRLDQLQGGAGSVITIAAGANHSVALISGGTVIAWGANHYGQTTIPAGLSGVTAIAAGAEHSLALKSDGTVVGWGNNNWGESTIPMPVGLSGVIAIAAGGRSSLALKSDGTVVGWGDSNWGGTTISIPVGLSGVTAIATGGRHALALRAKAP